MAKRVITLICLILLLAALCACSKRVENLDQFEQLVIPAASKENISESFASGVYVIIPHDCSAELVARAEELVLGINEKTGLNTYLKYDNESTFSSSGVLEILLGNTSRIVSQDLLRTRKADDYLCTYDRGALVIGGRTDEATIAALERFEKDILPSATNASLMHEAAHFEYLAEYDLDTVTLNGFYLYDYTVNADIELKTVADVLTKYILQKSGYLLEGNTSADKSINIAIDEDATHGIATIETKSKDIYIRADSAYGISKAIVKFADLLLSENEDGKCAFELNEKIFVEYESEKAELLIGAVEKGTRDSVEFQSALASDLCGVSSDAVIFLKVSDIFVDYFKYDLDERYDVILSSERGEGDRAVVCGKENVSCDTELDDGRIYVDISERDEVVWSVVLLESYDPDTVEAVEPYNTLLLIREDDALPPKYTNLQSLSFSFGGEAHVYRILTSQDILELTVTEGECVEIDGSAKIFWKVSVASKYHASFKDLQNSLN